MDNKLWRFIDNFGSFESRTSHKIKTLYFPLANEALMSSITPDLHGDIKTGQNSFLLTPVSRIDLIDSKSSRNFWIYIDRDKIWSATGNSKDLKQIKEDCFNLQAGLLWHKITRENKKIGLKAEILSFVPATGFGKRKPDGGFVAKGEPVEIMQVKITNITSQTIKFIPTSAIPIYARSANNLRQHRQVTSLLNRIMLHKFGVIVRPTLLFDESGHKPNKNHYFVLGWDEKFNPPQYIYPTQEMFCAEDGDLEAPNSIINNILPPAKEQIQGKEAMGALRFAKITLRPRKSHSYIILMGIAEDWLKIKSVINKFDSLDKVKMRFKKTEDFWISLSRQINLSTGDSDFDNWFCWVSIQPNLRRIFGCSFLPDFDYGRGGRGWRDLWQDCLGLILSQPRKVRDLLINNFSGVRIDGSNATIIANMPGEFESDRNNISRVWMDHGVWPLLTLDLYLNETADFDILFVQTPYFRNHELCRCRAIDWDWSLDYGQKLKTSSGEIYKGTILEHLLVQNLVQFFNVGVHNHVRLEGADWNDGFDMAGEFGESVAFSCMYAFNLKLLARWLLKLNKKSIKIAKEIKILFKNINYDDIKTKQKVLDEYFTKTKFAVSGEKISLNAALLADDLKKKSEWMIEHIRKKEWLKEGFFNGYYDNEKKRLEGRNNNITKMILISQVFPIVSGVATDQQIKNILKNVRKYLFDKRLKGYRLNTDFKEQQPNLGRAFSFVYGDKENGAFFNHMIVMFAYALYNRGYIREGWRVLKSIYNMAINTAQSRIYPCLPEYFNLEGRGMYSYLTGSASWFVLTLLTEVFGLRGKDGDLLIEPKLCKEQFKNSSTITINRIFSQRKLQVNFLNPKKLDFGKYKIIAASLNAHPLSLKDTQSIIIPQRVVLALPCDNINKINIVLG
jgi:cellobiose phosphorylase